MPDALVAPEADPAEAAVERDTIRLAFVAALQHLPPRQRAVLILAEVLRWKASEVAELLETSVASVNSALQRARATLDAADVGEVSDDLGEEERELLGRYVAAFEAYDMDALVEANDENRDAAEDLIDDLYEGKGLASAATMGLSDKLTEDESETHEPPTAAILLSGIRQAFALGPQTIIVIVAGSPPQPRALLDGVATLNRSRRVVIHTAGFAEDKDAPSALRDLARANGGVYLTDGTHDDEDSNDR